MKNNLAASISSLPAKAQVPPMARFLPLLLLVPFAFTGTTRAQGILTITPGRTAATTAGTGAVGYTGNGSAAISATLARPAAVAYDSNGNLYIADSDNHVVREVVKATGNVATVAGSGAQGYGGDGGAATSALLDTPSGVAVDQNGNIYIADSHNHRIRKVSGGNITTIAGTGVAGFFGDGNAATSAQLWMPSAVAVDTAGNVYIADTNNHRIREVSGTTITTIAGNGSEFYAGDGGTATAASLDAPTGVAVDTTGNVYIADAHNQRIRRVSGGTISTFAGSGAVVFGGGYGGDGAAATASLLANPTGVSVDAAGNVYVADTNNHRLRQIGGGAIETIAGTGAQGYGGDGVAPTGASYNAPRAVAADSSGNIAIADTLDHRIRGEAEPALAFGPQVVGLASTAQAITLSNSGTAAISVSAISFSGSFITVAGGTCPALPITLATSANCTQNVSFLPVAATAVSGSVTFSGAGVVPQSILLSGTGIKAGTTTTVATSVAAALVGQSVTFTATAALAGAGVPTGTVSFYDATTQLGTAQPLTSGSATISISTLAVGTHSITAVYSGDANFVGSTSSVLTQSIVDFNFTISSAPGTTTSETVSPGQPATFNFTVQPVSGSFNFPVVLSAIGLPAGSTASFTPSTIMVGSSAVSFSMMIQTPASAMLERHKGLFGGLGGGVGLALLLVPFAGRMRRGARRMRPLLLAVICVLGLAAATGLSGCGAGGGYFGQSPQTYTVQIVGTATGTAGATIQHFASVTLTVQ